MFNIEEITMYRDSQGKYHTTRQQAVLQEYEYLFAANANEIQIHVYNQETGYWEDKPLNIPNLMEAGIIWVGTDGAGNFIDSICDTLGLTRGTDSTTAGWYIVTLERELKSAKTYLRDPRVRREFRQMQFLDEHAPHLLNKPPKSLKKDAFF